MAHIAWEIVELHLEEASFLVGAFERALDGWNTTLAEVAAGEEERLLANIDGLVVAGPTAVERLLHPALAEGTPQTVQAAAMAILAQEDLPGLATFWPAFAQSEGPNRRAMLRALELSEKIDDAQILSQIDRAGPPEQAALCHALTERGVGLGERLRFAWDATEHAARWAAPEAAGDLIDRGLLSPDLTTRRKALESGVIHGRPAAWAACRALGDKTGAEARQALECLALTGNPEDHRRISKALEAPKLRPHALWALGFVGTSAAVEQAITALDDEATNALATEAIVAITGLDLKKERCLAPARKEADALPPLEEDDLEADLSLKEDLLLPRSDPEEMRRWWARAAGRFPPNLRHADGRPFDGAALKHQLAFGWMRRRHVFALEVAIRSGRKLRVSTRASTLRQRRQLAEWR